MSPHQEQLKQSSLVMKIIGWGLAVALPAALVIYPPGFLWGAVAPGVCFPELGPAHPPSPYDALHPYLFMIAALYIAYVASASLAVRRLSAQTSAGTVTISTANGVPNAGLGRLATTFAGFTVLFLGSQVATRWSATGHAPISNLYEFTAAFGFGIAAAYLAFEVYTRNRKFGMLGLPIVAGMLAIASTFPSRAWPVRAKQKSAC